MSEFTSLEEMIEEVPQQNANVLDPVESIPQQPSLLFEKVKSIVTMETGEGSIEDYVDHPLNFKKNKGMAQVLRGLTGIIGNLKLAVIDIGLGILNMNSKGDINNVGNASYYKGNGMG